MASPKGLKTHIHHPSPRPRSRYRLEPHPWLKPLRAPALDPLAQILTLAHIERGQLVAAVDDGLDADARDADAAAHRQLAQLEEMQADAAEGGIADGAAAEGEIEPVEVRAAEGEDLGGGVGEGAAEGLLIAKKLVCWRCLI